MMQAMYIRRAERRARNRKRATRWVVFGIGLMVALAYWMGR